MGVNRETTPMKIMEKMETRIATMKLINGMDNPSI